MPAGITHHNDQASSVMQILIDVSKVKLIPIVFRRGFHLFASHIALLKFFLEIANGILPLQHLSTHYICWQISEFYCIFNIFTSV